MATEFKIPLQRFDTNLILRSALGNWLGFCRARARAMRQRPESIQLKSRNVRLSKRQLHADTT